MCPHGAAVRMQCRECRLVHNRGWAERNRHTPPRRATVLAETHGVELRASYEAGVSLAELAKQHRTAAIYMRWALILAGTTLRTPKEVRALAARPVRTKPHPPQPPRAFAPRDGVGAVVTAYRLAAGLYMDELADEANVCAHTIQGLELTSKAAPANLLRVRLALRIPWPELADHIETDGTEAGRYFTLARLERGLNKRDLSRVTALSTSLIRGLEDSGSATRTTVTAVAKALGLDEHEAMMKAGLVQVRDGKVHYLRTLGKRQRARLTVCRRGLHPMVGDNLRWNKRGHSQCAACQNAATLAYNAKQKRKLADVACKVCGSVFAPRNQRHAVCSDTCRRLAKCDHEADRRGGYKTSNRGIAMALKTHCPQGHKYDFVDTYGRRRCRTCTREQARRSQAKRRAESRAAA